MGGGDRLGDGIRRHLQTWRRKDRLRRDGSRIDTLGALAPCEILVDGEAVERVVVSTDLTDPGREGQWAFSSMDDVKLDEATVLERRCVLRLATDE